MSSLSTLYSRKEQRPTTPNMIIIPDDVLLSNIFIRLRARKVAQMRSLSKTWNSLLCRPSFIKSHLDRSKDTNDEILMVFEDCHSKDRPFTEHTISQTDVQLTNSIKVDMNSSNSPDGTVVGSVNGLICLSSGGALKIWNPSLSALIALPPYTICVDNGNDYNIDFRFGFDPKTNDYKVVKVTYYFNLDEDDMTYNWLPVEVFSVRKGSWESITERFPSHNVQVVQSAITKNEVFVDGHDGRLHYLCISVNNRHTIVAFDLGDETFSEIALPDDCVYRANELAVLSRQLCVMSCVGNGDCEVWVMENNGVATNSWVKRYVIPKYDANDIVPVGFTSNNQFLFGHGLHLSLYDLEASTFRCLKGATFKSSYPFTEDTDLFSYSAKVVQYVDSLVWVTPS